MPYFPKPTLQARLFAGRFPFAPPSMQEDDEGRPPLKANGARIYPPIPGVGMAPPPQEPTPEPTPFELMKAAALAPPPGAVVASPATAPRPSLSPPLPPALRNGTYAYKRAPTAPPLPPPPKRDLRAGQNNAAGSLVAGLLAGLVTKNGNATTAAIRGYGAGASDATNDRDQAAQEAYQQALRVSDAQYKRDRQGVEDENQATKFLQSADDDFNTREVARYNAEVGAWDKEQDNTRQAGIDAAKQRGDLDATGQTWHRWLATLAPDAQQEEIARADRDGRLQRWGLNFEQAEDGRYISNLRAAPPQPTPYRPGESPAEKEAAGNRTADHKQLETDLREQYDLFSDPRLNKQGARAVAGRIAAIKKALGFGDGSDDAGMTGILDSMTPVQRAAIKQRGDEFAEGKRRTRATEAYRSQSLKQRAETARAQIADKLRTANGKAGDVFHKNLTRLSAIERALHPGGNADFTDDERSALELERDMLTAQQVFLAPKVPGLPKGTARKYADSMRAINNPQPDGTAEGDTAYLLNNRRNSAGRYDQNGGAAPASSSANRLPPVKGYRSGASASPPASTAGRKITVGGSTFTIRKKGGK